MKKRSRYQYLKPMRIKRICYPVEVLGPGKRVGIWVTGCGKDCPGCMSPDLKDPAGGRQISPRGILEAIQKITGPVDGITVSGGEPFDQTPALRDTLRLLCEQVTADVIVYTGYTLEELRGRGDPATEEALGLIAVLVDGRYVDVLNDGKGLRGSSNQRIHIFRDPARYSYMEDCERKLQVFDYSKSFTLMIGIM